MTADAGTTKKGTPYEMKFTDAFGNIHVRDVDRPDVISRFFQESNCVDRHNQARQFELAIEKKWLTDSAVFRLYSTMVGINVTDAWKLAAHHHLLSYRQKKNSTALSFAGILAKQLLVLAAYVEKDETISFWNNNSDEPSVSDISHATSRDSSSTNKRKWPFDKWRTENPIGLDTDKNGASHPLCQFEIITGKRNKRYRRNRTCTYCKKLSTFFCAECGTYCYARKPNEAEDTCFAAHVSADHRRSSWNASR